MTLPDSGRCPGPADAALLVGRLLVAGGFRQQADQKAAWPLPFDGRAVVAAWAWSGPRGYVGLFWTHDTQKDEIGVYEAVTDGVGHGVWFTAPLACPVALRIVGLGQVLQDEGYGPTLSIGREGDVVADLIAEPLPDG